jgi:acetyl-CoA synthetase
MNTEYFEKSDSQQWAIQPHLKDYDVAQAEFQWADIESKLNIRPETAYNLACICIDNHPETVQDKDALIWEGRDGTRLTFTFKALQQQTNRIANMLKHLGAQPGDRIFIFLDRIPELYQIVFGALKIQCIVGPLFSAFGPEALQDRIIDCQARFIITSPSLKPRVDSILPNCPSIERVILVDRHKEYQEYQAHEVNYEAELSQQSDSFTVEHTAPDTPSLIHYTSGTTGKPKGALHRHYSVLSQAATSYYVLDLHPESDIYWCTADPGWVTGTSYGMIGPWALGTTCYVYEGAFKPEKWYSIIQEEKITVWYTAPTAIRMLMKAGDELPQHYQFDSLRHCLSVGEPLNPEAIYWGKKAFGHVFHDTWWQTETGAMHICNYLTMTVKPGSMGKPFPGVEAGILNDEWEALQAGEEGHLAIRPTAPSMFQAYWGREEVFQSKFRKGWYLTGDRATRDHDGYYWFFGRSDDVINTAGHLVGPFEVESVLIQHPAVAEAGVIGKPDEERLEVIKAFISLKQGFIQSDALKTEIQQYVRGHLAAHAYPREIEFIESLPKTRSGKIMRRLLKARELGLDEGDTSTLEE